MRIITNNKPRFVETWFEIPESERQWFDYLTEDQRYDTRLVHYRGSWYDIGQDLPGWDGYHTDTFFSAVVVRWVPGSDYEQVVMGLALSTDETPDPIPYTLTN